MTIKVCEMLQDLNNNLDILTRQVETIAAINLQMIQKIEQDRRRDNAISKFEEQLAAGLQEATKKQGW